MPTTTYVTPVSAVNTIGARTDAAGVAVADLTAEEVRLLAMILTEGYLFPPTSYRVQAQTVADMTVRVGSGTAKADHYVVAGEVAGQGNYVVRLDVAGQNVVIDPADASQARTDELYLVVRDNVYDTSARALPQIGYRKGDLGGAVPGPDTSWKASALLARVAVPAAALTVTGGNVTDLRSVALLLPQLAVHGGLTGLTADDHPQYLNQARGDLRYYTETESDALLTGKSGTAHSHTSFNSLAVAGSISTSSLVKVGTTLYVESVAVAQSIRQTTSALGLEAGGDLIVKGGLDVRTDINDTGFSAKYRLSGPTPPKYYLYWSGSNIQFVREDTNTVTKTFVIPNPVDAMRFLVHATTESPHNGVEYWGEATVKDGKAVVTLPAYFEALCAATNRQVQVTVILPEADQSRAAGPDTVNMVDEIQPGEVEVAADGTRRPGRDRVVKVRRVRLGDPAVLEHGTIHTAAASTPKGGEFRIACSGPDGTRVAWLVKAVRKDVPALKVEPLRADNDLLGTGPYTYLVPKAKT